MAYGNRFRFRFDSVHGVEYNIYILKDGYTGTCDQRALGRAPVLKKQKNGPICGTSLDLYAQCVVDGEFAELYTSDPKEYRVDVYRAGTLIWTGFVSTELYSEPSIYPPYDVQIVATDGLGELKQVDFEYAGLVTLSEHIRTALSYTGANKIIYVASSLAMQGESVVDTFGMSINMDYLESKNYYDLLTELLNTLHATITLYGDKWLIARETDIEALLSNGALSVVSIATSGARSSTTISNVVKSVGAMGDADLWPNGNLSTSIDPARREVVVEAPWHNVPVNIEMLNWVTEGDVTGNYTLGSTGANGVIKKDISVDRLDCDIEVVLNLGALRDQARPHGVREGIVRVSLEYENSHLSDPIEGTASGWGARDPQYTEYNISNLVPRDFTFNFPSGSFSDPGTLRIIISGISVSVLACSIQIKPDNSGYRDTIKIDNGARGKDSAVEVTGSRALSDNIIKKEFYVGLWLYSGDVVLKFADSLFSNGDFLSITALSYATSAAMARIKAQGILDVPSTISMLPLLITFEGETLWIDTYEWDLKVEDATITALSLPSNTLTVESESVTPLPVGYSGSSGSGGSGSGSGAGSGMIPQQMSFFEEDGNGGIKLKDQYTGISSPGHVVAHVTGSGGGGGGGGGGLIDRLYRIADLGGAFNDASNDTFNAYTINSLHTRISQLEAHPGGVSSVAGLTGTVTAPDLFTALGLGAAATKTVGAVANANTGLVTGGDVYSFVNSSVATATATFRGTNSTATTEADFLTWANALTHDLNDYVFWSTVDAAGNTVYKRYKYNGSAWSFEYDLNNSSFTAVQWSAINSGITSAKITEIDNALAGKLDKSGGTLTGNLSGPYVRATKFSSGEHVDDSYGPYSCTRGNDENENNGWCCYSFVRYQRTAFALGYDHSNSIILGTPATWNGGDGWDSKWLEVGASTFKYNSNNVYHAGNSNSTSVGWSASTLTLAGAISGATNIDSLLYFDTTNDRIGIGTSTPTEKLDIQGGSMLISPRGAEYLKISSSDVNIFLDGYDSDGWCNLSYRSNGTTRLFINGANGRVGIGQSSPTTALDVTGAVKASLGFTSPGYVTAHVTGSSSDARLKDDIKTITPERAFSVLMALKPREWVWNEKSGELFSGQYGSGVVAQEAGPIIKDSVLHTGEYLHFDYNMLHGFEIAGLQSHEKRIKELEKKVALLERENAELKARIDA